MDRTRYGPHRFFVIGRIDTIDPNVVFSPFLYSNDAKELDIEFTRWGNTLNPNGQFVVQPGPYLDGVNRRRFSATFEGNYSTHLIDWRLNEVFFRSSHGHYVEPPTPQFVIQEWLAREPDIPRFEDNLKVHINLYLTDANNDGIGDPPLDGNEVEVQIAAVMFPEPDLLPPVLTISAPQHGDILAFPAITITGLAHDLGRGESGVASITVNGTRASNDLARSDETAEWTRAVQLQPGENAFTVIATDGVGNQTVRFLTVVYAPPDTTAPTLLVTSPQAGVTIRQAAVTVQGIASDAQRGNNGVEYVKVNGTRAQNDTALGESSAFWSKRIDLIEGLNIVILEVADRIGNNARSEVRIFAEFDELLGHLPLNSDGIDLGPSSYHAEPIDVRFVIDANGSGRQVANFATPGAHLRLNPLFLNNLENGTIAAWVFVRDNSIGTIVAKQHDSQNSYALLTIGYRPHSAERQPGRVWFHSRNGMQMASRALLDLNRWHHLAVAFSRVGAKLYINGEIDSEVAGDFSIPDDSATVDSLGAWIIGGAVTFPFNGYLDDFRVFGIAIPDERVRELFQQTAVPLQFSTVRDRADASTLIRIAGQSRNESVVIQRSITLTNWLDFLVISSPSQTEEISIPRTVDQPREFYRLILRGAFVAD